MRFPWKPKRDVLPGFYFSIGYTLFYLCVIVLIPLSATFFKAGTLGWGEIWEATTNARVMASYRITFGASFVAAFLNVVFGLLTGWVLVRYSFPGRRLIDALIDLPFALPTAVAGIALTTIYAPNGWIGSIFAGSLDSTGHQPWLKIDYFWKHPMPIAFAPLGVVLALTFIGFPFVVRTIQPVLAELHHDVEEAAATLGANRWQTFLRVILPALLPSLLTGFTLAFARAVGEYGSVVFISGNIPMKTEITPLLIMTKLEQYDYAGANAIAVVMLLISFFLILCVNMLHSWTRRRRGEEGAEV